MIISMNLREFLKQLVSEGQSQSAIARRANVSQSTINNLIHGAENPSMSTIKKIAEAYQKPASLFVAEASPPYETKPHMTDKEIRLLSAFRSLDERRQERFLDTIEDMVLALRESYAKENPTSILKGSRSGQN